MFQNINQKEYLKKYLSGSKIKNSKKSKRKQVSNDNSFINRCNVESEDDFELTGEDAPQIVDINDLEIIGSEASSRKVKWKSIGSIEKQDKISDSVSRDTQTNKQMKGKLRHANPTQMEKDQINSTDLSPPRKHIANNINIKHGNLNIDDNLNSDKYIKSNKVKLSRVTDATSKNYNIEKLKEQTTKYVSSISPVVHESTKKNLTNAETVLSKEQKLESTRNLYQQWGKGICQLDNYKRKHELDCHEYSKPVARYSNDKDLDSFLKEQNRHGDPMLAYINKKQEENSKQAAVYRGITFENRFNIQPGCRWDGVNRSNGYEIKYFDQHNNRKSDLHDFYTTALEDL